MCEFIKDGDTDELKARIIVGFVAIILLPLLLFRKSVRVQPDAGEACAGEQQPGFGFQPDGL